MSSTRRKSCIWSFFSLDEDTKYALCDDCQLKVSLGGATTTTYNTSNLVSHLKSKHPELYKKFESKKAQDTEEPTTSTSANAKRLTRGVARGGQRGHLPPFFSRKSRVLSISK